MTQNIITSVGFLEKKYETVDHMIIERSKFVQKKYMTKQDRLSEMINWELCKGLKSNDTTEWYIQKNRIFPRKLDA